jgi:hypothetical protein
MQELFYAFNNHLRGASFKAGELDTLSKNKLNLLLGSRPIRRIEVRLAETAANLRTRHFREAEAN